MSTLPAPTAPDRAGRRLMAALLVLVPPAYGLFALCFGQDANWDLRNYHWYNGYALVTGRIGVDLVPAGIPSFFNPLIDAPFYLLSASLPSRLVAVILGTLQGLNFWPLFGLALRLLPGAADRRPGRILAAAAVALSGLLGGGVLGMIATTFGDNFVSLGVLSALLALIHLWPRLTGDQPGRGLAWAWLAGLPAGMAIGLKQTSVIYCLALCAALLTGPAPVLRRLRAAFGFGLGVLTAMAALSGWWMLHLWQTWDNPLFPFMNHIFQSPYAAISDYRDKNFPAHSLAEALAIAFDALWQPLRLGEVYFRDAKIALLVVLLPLTALLAGWRPAGAGGLNADRRLVLATALFSLMIWLQMFGIYRYLVPLELLSPVALVALAGLWPLAPRRQGAVLAALLLGAQTLVWPANWSRVPFGDHWLETTRPDIADPDHSMVLMGGYWAISHVLGALPPQVPVVRIQSNFAQPWSSHRFAEVLRRRVAGHHGPLFMLSTIPDTGIAAEAAAVYDLILDRNACQVIANNLGEPLNFCVVRRPAAE